MNEAQPSPLPGRLSAREPGLISPTVGPRTQLGSPDAFGKGSFNRFLHTLIYQLSPIWALICTIFIRKYLMIPNGAYPRFAPAIVIEYVIFSFASGMLVYSMNGIFSKRARMAAHWATAGAYGCLILIWLISFASFFANEEKLTNECVALARNGEKDKTFGEWATPPPLQMNEADANDYCDDQFRNAVIGILVVFFITTVVYAYFMHAAVACQRWEALNQPPSSDSEPAEERNISMV